MKKLKLKYKNPKGEIITGKITDEDWKYKDGKWYPKKSAYTKAGIDINHPIKIDRIKPEL